MKKIKLALYFLTLSGFLACQKPPENTTPTPTPTPIDNYSLISLPSGWTKNATLSAGFPKTVGIFETSSPYRAFACVYDLSDTTLSLRTALNVSRQTPTSWLNKFTSEGKQVLMVANGGYFDLTNGSSYSLVVDSNRVLSVNVKALSRTYNGAATTYYPTRGAFGITQNSPSIGWIYNTMGASNYIYPTPSPNALNTAPQPVPSANFPAGGVLWSPSVAIGGSPVLVKQNTINVTDAAELIDVSNTSGRSRTAIGFTKDNRLVIVVIEKSGTSNGASLLQTAQLMKDWGCVDALNLDGGGSTCMLASGNQSTNAPEAGAQRAVTSVLYLMKK